jgi:hypothetical protein
MDGSDPTWLVPALAESQLHQCAHPRGLHRPSELIGGARISVVYFAFVSPAHDWAGLVRAQLQDLVDLGLADHSTVHVCLSMPEGDEALLERAVELAISVIPFAVIHRSPGNSFEYPGVLRFWQLGAADPSPHHYVLYHHSKGMVNGGQESRSLMNLRLTHSVVDPWRRLIAKFEAEPLLQRAGYAAAPGGWIWFNFFWGRASFIAELVRPIKTDRRHYYEDWSVHDNDRRAALRCAALHWRRGPTPSACRVHSSGHRAGHGWRSGLHRAHTHTRTNAHTQW